MPLATLSLLTGSLKNMQPRAPVIFAEIMKKAPTCSNVVHLRGAALRLTGYRVFDIFTALG
ncbi:hypothetical protein, partial [Vibrio vulnificus]|uniref:hypothetical protein n=1 Tax=Vibrio vulnificus TaxID=672 RepID=UPI001CDC4EFE